MNKNTLTVGMCEPMQEKAYIQMLLSPLNASSAFSEERSIKLVVKNFGIEHVMKHGTEDQVAKMMRILH